MGRIFNNEPHPAVNHVIKKSAQFSKPLYMGFIDHEKAFDSVNTAAALEAFTVQEKEVTYTRIPDDIYKGCTDRIILCKNGEKFPITMGVEKGDSMSPKQFTTCLEEIFRKIDWNNAGLRIKRGYLTHLRLAHDIYMLRESADHLEKRLQELQ